jgi:endonuclease G
VFVITGPLFQGGVLKRIGGRVLVPSATFKVIYDPNRPEAGAYVVENVPGARPAVVSVAELNKLAGLDLFPAVSTRVKERAMRLPLSKPPRTKSN